jgi:hypothetical protein
MTCQVKSSAIDHGRGNVTVKRAPPMGTLAAVMVPLWS